MADIPGLNFNIRQSLDRLRYQANVYNEEFVQRLLLVMGHPDAGIDTEYGVVAPVDPAATTVADTTPFGMRANATNTDMVDVNPGIAVTRSAMWMKLTEHARNIELADSSVGVSNVVYIRYLLDIADDEINDFNDPVSPFTMRIGSENSITPESAQIDVDTLEVYVNYDQTTRDNFVPLAVVTNQSVQDPVTLTITTQLAFDFTRDSYGWNRPWFSVADMEHRAQLGSGVQSSTNPHAISQNDLSVGDFSPLQLQLDHGAIIADDRSVAKVPGTRCQVSIPYTSLLDDDALGTKTAYPNAKYVALTNFPIRLGRVWVESTDEDWAAKIVQETNRVVFPYAPPAGEALSMYYTKVQACEPPVGVNESAFNTSNPATEELIIAGGSAFTMLANTQENFSEAQKIPMVYELLVDGDGALIKTPQIIYCHKRLDAISTSDVFTIDMYGPGKIMMALEGASGDPAMVVKVRLYGKDADGNTYDYLFEFDSTWKDPGPVPRTDIQIEAYNISDKVFSTVDQIVVEELTSYGPNASIMMWVALNPYDTYDKLKDACHVSEVMWDGLRLAEVRDKRIVNTTARDFLGRQPNDSALSYMVNVLAGGNETVYSESFLQPKYHNQIPNASRSSSLFDVLPANNISKLRVGAYGDYMTRALPVGNNPGTQWRVVLLPLDETRTNFYYENSAFPIFSWHDGAAWQADIPMTPVPGMFNTFLANTSAPPTMILVWLTTAEYSGMLIFG